MRNLFYIISIISILGCFDSSDGKKRIFNTEKPTFLIDTLFKQKNVKQIKFPDHETVYREIDSTTKRILFQSYLESDLRTVSFGFNAYFVSKQDEIGSLTPIIVNISGTDYSAQWLMLLNSNQLPVSKLELGHQEPGPMIVTDTSLTDWPQNINYFNHDTIKTVSVLKTHDRKSNLVTLDSLIFTRKILQTGEIITLKVDSSKYLRKY